MCVFASRTGDGAGDIANRFVESLRQIEHFAGRGVEERRNRPAQGFVLRTPGFGGERSLMATEERRCGDDRARVAFFGLQPKSRDGQFVGVADAQHLDPHQFRRNDDGVTAVA